MRMLSAGDIIKKLDLKPHPEGGHFRETFRDQRTVDGRAASTAIYFLLAQGERSHWHRVDAAEVWHYYAGAPLVLEMAAGEQGPVRRMKLGRTIAMGERPQGVVPAATGRRGKLGDWTLAAARSRRDLSSAFERFEMESGVTERDLDRSAHQLTFAPIMSFAASTPPPRSARRQHQRRARDRIAGKHEIRRSTAAAPR
jgi:predicted cupin superfamily sugar epimerase